MLRRRALTLLELLIAIAIIAAMTVIVAPNLLGRVDERRFQSAVDVLNQSLLLARAHAQSTGDPVEVRWVVDERFTEDGTVLRSHLEAALLRLELPDDGGGIDDAPLPRPEFASPADEPAATDETAIYEPWARQPLPEGIRITEQKPQWLIAPASTGPIDGRSELRALAPQDDAPRSLRLAVFLADGSALAGDTRWLVDAMQRTAELNISHWTGLPTVQRSEPSGVSMPAEPEEDQQKPSDDIRDEFDPEIPDDDAARPDGSGESLETDDADESRSADVAPADESDDAGDDNDKDDEAAQ